MFFLNFHRSYCKLLCVFLSFFQLLFAPATAYTFSGLPIRFDFNDVKVLLGYKPAFYLSGMKLSGGTIKFAWQSFTPNLMGRGLSNLERQMNIKFFLLALAIPNDQLWVNLNVFLNELQVLGKKLLYTDIGKVLMYSDVKLKEDVKDLILKLGLWDKLMNYAETISPEKQNWSFNPRFWVVPGQTNVFLSRDGIFIKSVRLDVMFQLESSKGKQRDLFQLKFDKYASDLIKKELMPRLVKHVNKDAKYAPLRQVYCACVLAQWCKEFEKDKVNVIFSELINSGAIGGLFSRRIWSPRLFLDKYVKMYKQGLWDNWGDTWQFYGGGVDFSNIMFSLKKIATLESQEFVNIIDKVHPIVNILKLDLNPKTIFSNLLNSSSLLSLSESFIPSKMIRSRGIKTPYSPINFWKVARYLWNIEKLYSYYINKYFSKSEKKKMVDIMLGLILSKVSIPLIMPNDLNLIKNMSLELISYRQIHQFVRSSLELRLKDGMLTVHFPEIFRPYWPIIKGNIKVGIDKNIKIIDERMEIIIPLNFVEENSIVSQGMNLSQVKSRFFHLVTDSLLSNMRGVSLLSEVGPNSISFVTGGVKLLKANVRSFLFKEGFSIFGTVFNSPIKYNEVLLDRGGEIFDSIVDYFSTGNLDAIEEFIRKDETIKGKSVEALRFAVDRILSLEVPCNIKAVLFADLLVSKNIMTTGATSLLDDDIRLFVYYVKNRLEQGKFDDAIGEIANYHNNVLYKGLGSFCNELQNSAKKGGIILSSLHFLRVKKF